MCGYDSLIQCENLLSIAEEEHIIFKQSGVMLCEHAAQIGNLELMIFLKNEYFPMNVNYCYERAALGGHKHILKWLLGQHYIYINLMLMSIVMQ